MSGLNRPDSTSQSLPRNSAIRVQPPVRQEIICGAGMRGAVRDQTQQRSLQTPDGPSSTAGCGSGWAVPTLQEDVRSGSASTSLRSVFRETRKERHREGVAAGRVGAERTGRFTSSLRGASWTSALRLPGWFARQPTPRRAETARSAGRARSRAGAAKAGDSGPGRRVPPEVRASARQPKPERSGESPWSGGQRAGRRGPGAVCDSSHYHHHCPHRQCRAGAGRADPEPL